MNKINRLLLAVASVGMIGVASCENTDKIDPNITNNVMLEFDNIVGNKDLVLNDAQYTNANGENFNVTLLKYYISNISLKNENGETVTIPKDESYFLVDEADKASQTLTLKNIPSGNYTSVSFIIGIDSLKNTAPVEQRTGVLDLSNAMYWAWNSGYIFLKMEGTSDAAPADATGKHMFRFHIGGYGGSTSQTINNIKTVTMPLATAATVRKTIAPTIHLLADAMKVMNGTTNVRISANSTTMFNPFSVNIANNYASMMSVDHVHNDAM